MNRIILIALVFMPFFSFCQIDKIGQSKSEIIKSTDGNPCKSSTDAIWYCGENGSLVNYTFKNNIVISVTHMWEFKTKAEAEKDVKNEIVKVTNQYGKPIMKGNQAFWFYGDLIIMVSYGNTNGKHYSCWNVSVK